MVVYVHGFASSPKSAKAEAFRKALDARGIPIEIPAMDGGDFEHLTISGQLAILEQTIRSKPVDIVGSSMGGLVASLYAAAHPEVNRLVLLAPAFEFAARWRDKVRATNPGEPGPCGFTVFHYGEGRIRRVHAGLIEDALRYSGTPDFKQPALIFHGEHDETVPVECSREFAAAHTNTRLVELDSDHELLSVLDRIVAEAMPFLM
ncbi:MAG TPA: YqiA/YcfP family alpha/beta fold hydrolase [Bryobacteraceae bacterium]|nr:YqiA/YcfP family alpha/beta fold hydrolase [Bryobacteraceae bacterium]